ncbi:MAG: DUF4838 domain-containing protein [Armatimonadetes bacterium]|nr:DUF4838 domain-containing protein [Armatimonadota bacterium]
MSRTWIALAMLAAVVAAHALEVSRTSAPAVIVARDATAAEQTAAREVCDYLGKVTGTRLSPVSEANATATRNRIYVGPTAAAAKRGIDAARLGPEEWIVRTAGSDLYLIGGRPRGTIYAACHFLEDVVGVHWWTPWEESVPARPTLKLTAVSLRGTPAFRYRDIYMIYGHDGGRFSARNRLNREGDAAVDSQFGGTLAYGPPYHVHTFNLYFPPQEHYAQHPEWYSLIDGKRTPDGAQLCLTNPDLRQAFQAKLLSWIETSWAAAKAANLPPPLVFSISQNDCAGPCQCDACQTITKAEGSEAGPLIDFVNFMADAAKDKYPEVFIDTLAYQYTQTAPKTIKPRDNVIIRLCDTEADMLKPITAPENKAFQDHILSWARIARNLRIWDYAVTYGSPQGMPLPTTHTFGPDYRFYAAHHVEGVFTELEYEILADLRDFKIWCVIKTLENPNADYDRLTDTFMNGYYGAAGKLVKQYLRGLEAEAAARKSRSTCWQGSPMALTYLNLGFVTRAQKLFDDAEQAVRADPVLTRRARYARLSLDRATLAAWPKLLSEWQNQARDPERFPLDRDAVAQRALNTWNVQIDTRLLEAQRERERLAADGEIARFALVPSRLGVPEKFRDYPRGTTYDYTAIMTRNWNNEVKVVKDPEAESGITNRLELTAPDISKPERYVLPMPWGLYGTADKKFIIIQLDIDNAFDPAKPDQKLEFWARIKFEGPRFPHAKAGDKDAICVERVVLVKPR